jgi:tetratricopeptide (TPR) repeat protein
MATSDRPRAQRLAGEGLERSTRLRMRYPERDDVLDVFAEACFSSAIVADTRQALDLWTRSNEAYRELVDRLPDNADVLRSLALTEKYIGTVHELAKRLDLALPRYERALELDRQVQQLRPNDRRTIIDLAFDLGNIASIHWRALPPDRAQAAALYRESLALRERASATDPQDVFARQAVGFALIQLADLERQSGNVEAALRYGRRAVDLYESLPRGEFQARRGHAWRARGLAAHEAQRPAEACEALRRAQRYYQEVSKAALIEQQMLPRDSLSAVAIALETCAP